MRPAVATELQWFLDNRKFLDETSLRADPYLYFIVDALEERGLPVEIALLPVIESGYQSAIQSPSGAAGLWQFMSGTGRRYGLRQSKWYDGRRDVVASTRAAIHYLAVLNEHFDGDWLLAIAAYNCGAGVVDRAIEDNRRRRRPVDFWSLKLPRETGGFVPRLLALAEVVRNSERYGITLHATPDEPHFAEVVVPASTDLRNIARWADLSTEQIRILNPAFKTWYTDASTKQPVLVPVGARAEVAEAVANWVPATDRRTRQYAVRPGDNLGAIAARFGVSVEQIRGANRLRGNLIHSGQMLTIPGGEAEVVAAVADGHAMDESAPERTAATATTVHVVRSGETLWDIARHYDAHVKEIAGYNDLLAQATLQPGQKLTIPLVQTPSERIADIPPHYRVREGDSLWTVSRKFRVSVEELATWNNLSNSRHLKPGQRLIIRPPAGLRVPT